MNDDPYHTSDIASIVYVSTDEGQKFRVEVKEI